jgi:hypothetical protein
MTTPSIDTDMSGTLLTTEWGNPPQSQPAGVDNYQGYGATGQGLQKVYKYLYDPADNTAPLDESEGGLALQEQKWVGEVEILQQADPAFLTGEIVADVVFENPLDTLNENARARSAGENIVDFDAVVDPIVPNPIAYGVTEETPVVEDTVSEPTQEGTEVTEVAETPVVAPEPVVTPVADEAPVVAPVENQE